MAKDKEQLQCVDLTEVVDEDVDAAVRFLGQLSGRLVAVEGSRSEADTAAAYLERKQAEGKSRKEAPRCLKRHLARRVWKLLHTSPVPATPTAAPRTGTIVGTAPGLMPCLT